MSTAPARRSRAGRVVLHAVSWKEYSRLLRVFAERLAVRLTYDRGVLEITSPLAEHQMPADVLARFVLIAAEELRLPVRAGGSSTLRRRRRQRGIEPDKCWWIANAHRLQGRIRIDLRRDPPPDLAVEVDITSSSLNRIGIYATLGIREIWCLHNDILTFHVFDTPTGTYQVQTHSLAFPMISSADLAGFLAQVGQVDDTTLGLQFRAWLRQRLGRASAGPPPSGTAPPVV
jgi:Uma2 family endonuclease